MCNLTDASEERNASIFRVEEKAKSRLFAIVCLRFDREDGDNMHTRNVCKLLNGLVTDVKTSNPTF
jgi:hypothetical protein